MRQRHRLRATAGDGAQAVPMTGDLGARVEARTKDVLGLLVAELEAMAAALAEHERRLAEAERLAEVGRLAAGIAHELNNPLQAILGYLSLPRAGAEGRMDDRLAAVEREAIHCRYIVEGLLDLSRPGEELERTPVDLRPLCEDVARAVRLVAGAAASEVGVAGTGRTLAHGPRVRQVLLNLVRNAVEASGPGGRVEVRVAERGAEVEVSVRDSGSGVPEAVRARLFEPFFTTKVHGTGLGLAVSRAVARANGGDLRLGESGPAGATFTLWLPRAGEGEV